jgi:hypothetical protein
MKSGLVIGILLLILFFYFMEERFIAYRDRPMSISPPGPPKWWGGSSSNVVVEPLPPKNEKKTNIAKPEQSITPAAKGEPSLSRIISQYADINTDTSSYDFDRVRQDNIAASRPTHVRGSQNSAGGVAAISLAQNQLSLATVVDQPPSQVPILIPGQERPDQRCGPSFGSAVCGPGRCCSIQGWCGIGTNYCSAAYNNPLFNGVGANVISSHQQAQIGPCTLNCASSGVSESAKYYYDNVGGWKGTYVMRPLAAVKSGDNTCDISYEYRPANNPNQPTASGIDKRRFTFSDIGNCIWNAVGMGDYMSGTMAP